MKANDKTRYRAPALEKGLDILEFLAKQPMARSQTEIGQALNRSQGEIYRMLSCLEQRGYVRKEEHSANFGLTLRLYEIAHQQSSTVRLRHAALLPLDALAEETGQSCHLSVQHGSSLMVMMERMPRQQVCLAVGEGKVLPLSQSTSGKILLARMTEDGASKVLEDDTYFQELSVAKRKSVLAAIAQARKTQHVVEKSVLTTGTANIAVPVGLDHTDTAGVIAIPFVSTVVEDSERATIYLNAALKCAVQINHNLGINS